MRMMRDFVHRTPCPDLLPTGDALTEAIGRVMALPSLEVLLSIEGGETVGGIGILYVPFLWNPDILTAEELFWWTARDAPFRTAHKLFTQAMKQIEEKHAVPMFRTLQTSPDGVARLYARAGMRPVETLYMGGF